MSLIGDLYNLYVAKPEITNDEAAELLGTTPAVIDTYRYRLREKGIIDFGKDKVVKIQKEYKARKGFKLQIYEEMIAIYMNDFRSQDTFADRVCVGREIRLILERM